MAATRIALRKPLMPPSALVLRLINNPVHSASSAAAPFRRLMTTDAQVAPADDTSRAVDVSRQDQSVSRRVSNRTPPPALFSDIFDPLLPTRSLSQVLNLMDQFFDDPFFSSRGFGAEFNRNWDVREDDNTLYLRIDMPGLSKEDVKVIVEQNTLVIRGEGLMEEGEGNDFAGGGGRRYSGRIDLPPNRYKVDEIKAEMKHGVLKVVVPKVKDEERQDVVEVTVDG